MNTIAQPEGYAQKRANYWANRRDHYRNRGCTSRAAYCQRERYAWQLSADVEYRKHSAQAHGPAV